MKDLDADRIAYVYGEFITRYRPTGTLGRIARELSTGTPSRRAILKIIQEDGRDADLLQPGILDLVIEYVRSALDDNHLSVTEQKSVGVLKRLLDVREGDFWRLRRAEISTLLRAQLEAILSDGVVSWDEALQKVELQRIFDLGYDQFLEVVGPLGSFKEEWRRLEP